MNPERFLFSVFAAMAIISGSGVVVLRDPVKGALSLVACFFSIACLYLLQAAELIAVLEVLVYAGAIMVLFVFVIMLVEEKEQSIIAPGLLRRIGVGVNVFAVALITTNIAVVLYRHRFGSDDPLPAGFGSPATIGKRFFADYLFHFELTSVLLLVAIVGAVMISRVQKESRT